MQNRFLPVALVFSALLAVIHLLALFFPSALNWGFHFLAFLPPFVALLYVLAAVAGCFGALSGRAERWVASASDFLMKRPLQSLSLILTLFVVSAAAFRISAPLLGDSFYLVRNYSESLRGVAPLYARNEPLATYYFALLLNARHVSTFGGFMTTFFVADLLLGIGFIVNAFVVLRKVLSDSRCQLLALLLVLVVPYMQVFFGYVETYSVVLFTLSLYILACVLNLKGKAPFPLVPLSFLLLALVHYLSILTLPSLLYVAYREYRHRGLRPLLIGFGGAAAVFLALLVGVNFDVSQFSSAVPHHHYLSISTPQDAADAESQAYTLISPFHAVDLANYLVLMSPGVFLLLIFAAVRDKLSVPGSPVQRLLLLAAAPVFSFLLIVKFDLGAAKDWDVFAPYFFLPALLAGISFLDRPQPASMKIASLVIVISALNSLVYVDLNSTKEASIRRYLSLSDPRTFSHLSQYAFSLHLSQYYHQVQNRPGAVDVWKRFIASDPSDGRGYRNLITNLGMEIDLSRAPEHAVPALIRGQIRDTYERWLIADSTNDALKTEFTRFCIDAGNESFNDGRPDDARSYYSLAIKAQPDNANAYNNLGSVYAQEGKRDRAVELYRKALGLRPEYPEALINLGNLYAELGDSARSRELLARASRLMKAEPQQLSADTTGGRRNHQ
ncbi:MAG TPA: tetratricopeptide repeat protein [Bacteroidota bacterium]|nr:tetratricopeptide repeat protein [Bacteroidota bacterium]